MKTVDQILDLYRQRVNFYGNLHSKMRAVQEIYQGTARIPLPEVERNEMASRPQPDGPRHRPDGRQDRLSGA